MLLTKKKRSRHASRAASSRYNREAPAASCSGMPEYAQAGNTIPNQTSPSHTNINSAEPEQSSAAAPAIPLIDGTEFFVEKKDIAEWQQAYPAVDVEQELREMRAWCQANPKLRKTKNGVRRFIVSWLARQQDKGHPGMAVKPKSDRTFTPTEF